MTTGCTGVIVPSSGINCRECVTFYGSSRSMKVQMVHCIIPLIGNLLIGYRGRRVGMVEPALLDLMAVHHCLTCNYFGLSSLHHPWKRNWDQQRMPLSIRSEEHTSELQSQFHLVCR